MTEKEVLEFIMRRRSVRKFTGEPVPKEKLEVLLKAAMAAPSARNRQPWEFLVLTEREKIREVCTAHPYAKFGVDAGAVIIPLGKPAGNFYFFQDMAAAVENLLLAAANLGLGATWCGMDEKRQDAIHPLLGVPQDYWIFAVIPVGVPAEHPEPRTQYDPAKVHWQRFGQHL
ncbi:nitroreductase family protein [Candidatus Bipolaricaulota bacterium]|nr:nitroreductase family protein [Candidatus Bipolaricaulota bacterium]